MTKENSGLTLTLINSNSEKPFVSHVVTVVTLYFDDPCSNPLEVCNFIALILQEKNEN